MYEAKKQQNLELLDDLAWNSANKGSFTNPEVADFAVFCLIYIASILNL